MNLLGPQQRKMQPPIYNAHPHLCRVPNTTLLRATYHTVSMGYYVSYFCYNDLGIWQKMQIGGIGGYGIEGHLRYPMVFTLPNVSDMVFICNLIDTLPPPQDPLGEIWGILILRKEGNTWEYTTPIMLEDAGDGGFLSLSADFYYVNVNGIEKIPFLIAGIKRSRDLNNPWDSLICWFGLLGKTGNECYIILTPFPALIDYNASSYGISSVSVSKDAEGSFHIVYSYNGEIRYAVFYPDPEYPDYEHYLRTGPYVIYSQGCNSHPFVYAYGDRIYAIWTKQDIEEIVRKWRSITDDPYWKCIQMSTLTMITFLKLLIISLTGELWMAMQSPGRINPITGK